MWSERWIWSKNIILSLFYELFIKISLTVENENLNEPWKILNIKFYFINQEEKEEENEDILSNIENFQIIQIRELIQVLLIFF